MTRVMILAAGYGSRLRPLTDAVPKPMVPLGDRPLAAQILRQLRAQGFTSAVLNTHHLPHAFSALAEPGIELSLSHEPDILGSAGGVHAVSDRLQPPCFIWNGDIWTRPDLDRLGASLQDHAVCLLVAPTPGAGSVGLDAQGQVVRLRGELFGTEVQAANYVGVMLLGERALAALPERGCLIGDLCLPLLRAGESVGSCWHAEPWYDVGTVAGYLAANLSWLGQRTHYRAPNAHVGPAVVCERSVVGADARVEGVGSLADSVVWPGARATAPLRNVIVYGAGALLRVGNG